jgi:hypothetical protein
MQKTLSLRYILISSALKLFFFALILISYSCGTKSYRAANNSELVIRKIKNHISPETIGEKEIDCIGIHITRKILNDKIVLV